MKVSGRKVQWRRLVAHTGLLTLPRVAYRPREAAEVTGLSLRFLYYAIQHKDLPTVRVGRCRLITEKALREWLERKTEASVETHDSTG